MVRPPHRVLLIFFFHIIFYLLVRYWGVGCLCTVKTWLDGKTGGLEWGGKACPPRVALTVQKPPSDSVWELQGLFRSR